MDPIGVGVIGTGVGRRHAQGLIKDERVRKIVMCSKDVSTLNRVASEVGTYRGDRSEPEPIQDAYGISSGSKAVGIAHLLDCIERDETPLVNVYEGARGIAVCDAIQESHETEQPVKVSAV